MSKAMLYDDGEITCDDTSVLIRRYYPWGSKRILYSSIKSVERLPIRIKKWRLWGSGDFRHWWNLDPNRPKKDFALEIDNGRWIHPTITPDNVETVEDILRKRLGQESP